ncbi:hypothetical protein [Bacteriovorax sp. DB6_IX]|uniref:hypothetical protein n=1 Tax=Bacteriovorax sp. DB6_IX TaxID=1353530 RepID=UPI00038A41D3|nr:hypothetical protein [Bacteriovorax sp. DB6_IX]EQC51566.1 hypothetical protein M901_0800 [Bacteriovorax sp. DB6_IX]
MIFQKLLEEQYKRFDLASGKERRELLATQMYDNEAKGLDCMSCTGRCCTYEANSMQMTSVEALEAMALLEKKGLLTEEVKSRLEDCVKEFRLDQYIQIASGEFFRKSYTCPFYFYPSFGCGLGVDSKPYGCIAFNPCESGQKDGGNCQSDLDIQEKRNEIYEESEELVNKNLFKEEGISLMKEPIPVKLLEFWNKYIKES